MQRKQKVAKKDELLFCFDLEEWNFENREMFQKSVRFQLRVWSSSNGP